MSAPLAPEQRARIAAQLGDAMPATDGLIESFGKSVQERREHEHPTWEDFFCLNLSSYMGERMAPVLRRLIDAEAEVERLREFERRVTDELEEFEDAAKSDPNTPTVAHLMIANLRIAVRGEL